MSNSSVFDQESYWKDRHKRLQGDPRSVGHLGKSREENFAAERRMQRWVSCAAVLLKPYRSILDIGCGYGRIAKAFCDAGYVYTGIDISQIAVDAAKKNEPRGTYIAGSPLDETINERFDLVCVLYVFVHFVNDADWEKLILWVSSVLTPGGAVLFADNFTDTPQRPAPHVKLRPISDYEVAFKKCDLKLDLPFTAQLAKALGIEVTLPVYLARKVTEPSLEL